MTAAFATVGGFPASRVAVYVPHAGAWFAEVDFEGDPDVSGKVSIKLGALELVGTVDARHDGTHGLQRRARIVAGAGGWSSSLAPKAYHNDAGIKARLVAEDAAREAGETLGSFSPAVERVGVDYVRRAGLASAALEDAAGGALWWVDFEGKTHAGERSTSTPAEGSYELLEYAPDERVAVLAVDDLRAVGVGSVLSERLDAPQTIRDLEILVEADRVRVKAWCGGDATSRGRLAGALVSLIERATDGQLFGLWRYRVIGMDGDRVKLQAVSKRAGLPDILPIPMWPGAAGVHAELAPGAEVLVEFVEGRRSQPVISHFAGKAGPGWAPVRTTVAASTEVLLGDAAASDPVALKSDLQTLKSAINGAAVAAGDGGAAFKANLLAALAAWPASSTKVKAV